MMRCLTLRLVDAVRAIASRVAAEYHSLKRGVRQKVLRYTFSIIASHILTFRRSCRTIENGVS